MARTLDIIQQPPSQPYRYGLFSAATAVVDDPAFDPRGASTWRIQGCTPGGQWATCWQAPPKEQVKAIPPDAWLSAEPFFVYDGVQCSRVGFPDSEQVASARLALSEQGQVERHLWAQLAASDPTVLAPADQAATDLLDALSRLEGQLAATTGAAGIIHAPRAAASHLARMQLVWRDGAVWRTAQGTPVAFGGGYSYAGPDGKTTTDVAWLYATGPVVVRRGAVQRYGGDLGGFDQRSNQVVALVERPYLVTVDCPAFAAATKWKGRPATVWPAVPDPLRMTLTVDPGDPHTYTAAFTGASCERVAVDWGDGSSDQLAVTDGSASGQHTYSGAPTPPVSPKRT